ncbi:MAG: response regulator [Bacteroidales bacterium]|nr:response regulator [Bacteroidales bacterium]
MEATDEERNRPKLPDTLTSYKVTDEWLSRLEQAKGRERVDVANYIFLLLDAAEITDSVIQYDYSTPEDLLLGQLYFWVGEQRLNDADFVKAADCLTRAATLFGTSYPQDQNDCLSDLSICYCRLGLFGQAFETATKVIEMDEATGDISRLAVSYNTLGVIYMMAKQPEDAEKYIRHSLELVTQMNDTLRMGIRYGALSEVLLNQNKPGEALDQVNEALRLDSLRGDESRMAIRRVQKASILDALGQIDAALTLLDMAQPVLEQVDNMVSLSICLNQQGNLALKQQRWNDAEHYFKRCLEIYELTGDRSTEMKTHYGLWKTLCHSDINQAARHLERYTLMRDSAFQTEMTNIMADYDSRYELNELSMQNQQERDRNRLMLAVGSLSLLILVVVVLALLLVLRMKSRTARMQHQLQQARDQFFTNITHELRTPLTVINSATEEIVQERDVAWNAETIKRHSHSLLELINQMLDIARMSHAPQARKETWRQMDVVAFVAMMRESYEHYAASQGIQLVYSSCESRVMMDTVEDYLAKIMRNLISNAIKFSSRGTTVTISTKSDAGRLNLKVADQGPGIAPDDLAHIFEPFYQATTDTSLAGSGIGLPLARLCVEALHGTIRVESSTTEGTSGTVFTVELPIQNTAPIIHPMPVIGVKTGVIAAPTLVDANDDEEIDEQDNSVHLLIVEDAAEVAYYVSRIVPADYHVSFATDGNSALIKARQQVPDIIITDVMMPGMDGLELCREVRKDPLLCHIPVVMVTARVTAEDRIIGLQAGADAYLQKPFQAEELSMCVQNLLEQRRRWQERYAHAGSVLGVLSGEGGTSSSSSEASEEIFTRDSAASEAVAPDPFMLLIDEQLELQMQACSMDLAQIADNLCITRTQLNRKVKAIVGMTMRDYASHVRTERACRLLLSGEMKIAEVAMACGFEDEAYFSRFFRKQKGITPSDFASQQIEGEES